MSIKTVGVLAGALWGVCLGQAASAPAKLSGGILGMVSDASGVPQMGAAVYLYDRYDRLVQRIMTSDEGTFGFDHLSPDTYAIRVSLASFLPAMKRGILVQPGMRSLLNVNLATVFSSIQLVAAVPGDGSLMTDDWKWVLRSAGATRPILRLFPEVIASRREPRRQTPSVFSSTRGLVKVSAGDQGSLLSAEPDLGTAFALATMFLGKNQLQVSGNIGYSSYSGMPATAFRTSFRREMAGGEAPEVNVTMRQAYLPARAGAAVLGGMQESAPVLRSITATVSDQTRLTENTRFEYGFTLDSVTFLDHLNYFSPWGRLTYDRGDGEVFQFAYASGAPPTELLARDSRAGMPLQQDLSTLALFPRVSLRSGQTRVQRTGTWEFGYRRAFNSRTFGAAVFRESVSNASVMLAGVPFTDGSLDLLPDVFSESAIFNAGGYSALGFIASLTQNLGEHMDATLAYCSSGALTAGDTPMETGSPDELRTLIRRARRRSLTARVSGHLSRSGTQFATSYEWADVAAITPSHVFLTQPLREGVGLNVRVRQPIPYFGGLPGHLEATADLRNLLAQGYVPLVTPDRRMYLVQAPRSVRGGLSFVF
jgi:hypothetical protein